MLSKIQKEMIEEIESLNENSSFEKSKRKISNLFDILVLAHENCPKLLIDNENTITIPEDMNSNINIQKISEIEKEKKKYKTHIHLKEN